MSGIRSPKPGSLSGAIADLQRRADAGLPLFDDMKCACCGGDLRVYVDPVQLRDPKAKHSWYESANVCDTCSFRRCPKGDLCVARRAA